MYANLFIFIYFPKLYFSCLCFVDTVSFRVWHIFIFYNNNKGCSITTVISFYCSISLEERCWPSSIYVFFLPNERSSMLSAVRFLWPTKLKIDKIHSQRYLTVSELLKFFMFALNNWTKIISCLIPYPYCLYVYTSNKWVSMKYNLKIRTAPNSRYS